MLIDADTKVSLVPGVRRIISLGVHRGEEVCIDIIRPPSPAAKGKIMCSGKGSVHMYSFEPEHINAEWSSEH